ncbi:MAG: efflux RND transporter periplasmic adaptor subunit [Phycisphaerae bacterium]
MNRTTTVLAVIAVVIGLGGGVAALSRLRAQHTPGRVQPNNAHDHVDERHGTAHPHQQEHEEAGHHEEDQDEHDEHGAESVVQLSREERSRFGVVVATAGSGRLTTQIRLPGELVLNADRVAHIVPRAPGIVREVLASVGDSVHAGEVMAWIESAELGEVKVDYLARWAALGSSSVDLVRAREVHHNTARLLEVLDSSPSLETLRQTEVGGMGENRSILVSAYAEFVFAKAAYLRERPLFEKKIASERDYQAAEAEYKKADALYAATRDSMEFKIRRDLLEAERTQQVREIELQGARRHLYVLGLTSEEIAELERLAELQMRVSARNAMCDDPHCKTCQQAASNNNDGIAFETNKRDTEEKLAWYPLRAPFDATVIEKHLSLGEKHSDESGAFTVADLTSVWVNIAVYQKDLSYVRKGMEVIISAGVGMPYAQGTIAYVSPVVDEKTRTALARVVLPNPDGRLRPGLFVNAEISIGQESASVVIPKSAVQRMGQKPVVFLDTSEGFKPKVVSLGRSNESHVEVLAGLAVGQRYVTHGAFELKAKIVTSGLGAHAGHGH